MRFAEVLKRKLATAVPPANGTPGLNGTHGAPRPALPILYYEDLSPVLETADFVEGLLIDGGLSVVYGESNCGKTFFSLDLALRVADGAPWRGRGVDRRGVLYLALEGAYGVRNRVSAWRKYWGVPAASFAVVPVQVDLLDPAADAIRVIEAAAEAGAKLDRPVGLVVVDTLSRAIVGGNENSSEDMGAFVRNVDMIRHHLPGHVQVVHHSGKDAAKGARGHSLLRAATDTEIEVTRDLATGVSTAKVTKQRDLPCDGEFAFRLDAVELGTDRRGKPVTSCVVMEAETVEWDEFSDLSGDQQAALNALKILVAERGVTGFGAPEGVRSVPVEWWRQRVYQAKPHAGLDARKKGFQRTTDHLKDEGYVMFEGGRVWLN